MLGRRSKSVSFPSGLVLGGSVAMDVLLCCFCVLLLLASAASAASERCVQQGKAAYSPSLFPVPHHGKR